MTQPIKSKWYGFVPNMVTSFNLVSGSIAVYFALNDELRIAGLFMFAAALFDFLDGFVARLLHVSGDMGKELDSLSDMVSFGLLPGAIVFSMQRTLLTGGAGFSSLSVWHWGLLLSCLVIPVLSAIRLAKFNLDTRQKTGFIGLPTPANAMFWASFAWVLSKTRPGFIPSCTLSLVIAALTLLFSLLLVSEIPMFALKFTSFKWKGNQVKYVFLVIAGAAIATAGIGGVAISILIYIFISLIFLKKSQSITH